MSRISLHTSETTSSEPESLHLISPPLSRAGVGSQLYIHDDVEFNVWSTDGNTQRYNNLSVAVDADKSLPFSVLRHSHSDGGIRLDLSRDGSRTFNYTVRRQSLSPPTSPNYPLRLTGRKYLPGVDPELMDAARKKVRELFPSNDDTYNLAPIRHSNARGSISLSSLKLPADDFGVDHDNNEIKGRERGIIRSKYQRNQNISYKTSSTVSRVRLDIAKQQKVSIHHSMFDTSPIQAASPQKKAMDNYKKVIPYGPVWGQDALYDGNNKKKNKNKNTPARRKKFSNHHSFHNRQQSSLEPLGNKEKKFHRIMSMTKVTRNEIPTQRRKVFRIAKTNVKARTGIMTLSKSMGALRAERTHGLSLNEIKRSTNFALQTAVDPMSAYREQQQLQQKKQSHRIGYSNFEGDEEDQSGMFGGVNRSGGENENEDHDGNRILIPSVNDIMELPNQNIEHEVFKEIRERQKSRELVEVLSRERSRQKSRKENRFRSSSHVDIAHTRMSLKAVHHEQKKPAFVNIEADFAGRHDNSKTTAKTWKSGKPW